MHHHIKHMPFKIFLCSNMDQTIISEKKDWFFEKPQKIYFSGKQSLKCVQNIYFLKQYWKAYVLIPNMSFKVILWKKNGKKTWKNNFRDSGHVCYQKHRLFNSAQENIWTDLLCELLSYFGLFKIHFKTSRAVYYYTNWAD